MGAVKQQKQGWEVALDLLNNSVNEIKADVKDIKTDVGELKTDIAVLKSQNKTATVVDLTSRVQAIEIRNSERDTEKKWNLDRLSAYGALIVSVLTAVIIYFNRG